MSTRGSLMLHMLGSWWPTPRFKIWSKISSTCQYNLLAFKGTLSILLKIIGIPCRGSFGTSLTTSLNTASIAQQMEDLTLDLAPGVSTIKGQSFPPPQYMLDLPHPLPPVPHSTPIPPSPSTHLPSLTTLTPEKRHGSVSSRAVWRKKPYQHCSLRSKIQHH